jgi:benzoyl-CoA reductase subunit C
MMEENLQHIQKIKNDLIQYYENPRATADAWKANGGKVMGYLCSYVPEEILFAAGVLPMRVLGHLDDLSVASSYFQPFVCRLIRSTLEKGLMGKLDYLEGIIISYTCDGMRMLYDTWETHVKSRFAYLLDLPSSLDSPTNLKYFSQAIQDLASAITRHTGNPIPTKNLKKSISIYNRYRRLAKELYYLRTITGLPLSSEEFMKINLAALCAPKDVFSDKLEALLNLLKTESNVGFPLVEARKSPVHISGAIAVDPVFYQVIDHAGGTVVSDDLCTGTRYYWDEVNENGDPILALVQRYISRVTCPSKYPAPNRASFQIDRIKESKALGVVILGEKYCDPHLFDIPATRKRIEELGVPTLWLETELVASGREQLATRLEAFMDILKAKEEKRKK